MLLYERDVGIKALDGDAHMNLKQLRYFVAIAEEHQITAAARRLHISQPPLSYELAQLEKELGTQLVVRGARNARLTDAGQILYQRALRILEMTNATEREVAAFGQGLRGMLSIGTISSSGSVVPNRSLREYFAEHPDITLEVHEGNTYQVLEMLRSGIVDVGVVRTPFKAAGLGCVYAEPEPMVAFMGGEWEQRFADHSVLHPTDLAGAPLIVYRRFESLIRESFDKRGIAPNIVCINDDARTTVMWARIGYGIGLAPYSLTQIFADLTLAWKKLDCPELVTRQAAVWDATRFRSPLVERFIAMFPKAEQQPKGGGR